MIYTYCHSLKILEEIIYRVYASAITLFLKKKTKEKEKEKKNPIYITITHFEFLIIFNEPTFEG